MWSRWLSSTYIRTKNGVDLWKEVVRIIPSKSEVIHEGQTVLALLVRVTEEKGREAVKVDVVLREVGPHQQVLHRGLDRFRKNFFARN